MKRKRLLIVELAHWNLATSYNYLFGSQLKERFQVVYKDMLGHVWDEYAIKLHKMWSIRWSLLMIVVLTAHNWQNWKRVFLTCPCDEIYRDEAVV